MQTKTKAFTLVELLVAMAIIGIILGLALFGISAAQRNARDTQRRSTVQDINAGIADLYTVSSSPVSSILYVNDAGGYYALVKRTGDGSLDKAGCDGNPGCVAVPLEGAAVPSSVGTQPSLVMSNTDTDSTEYYFATTTDGYFLSVCLESNSKFDGSTASAASPQTCP